MKPRGWIGGALGTAMLAHYLPSVAVLGQWTSLRSLPGGWCTWRGPDVDAVALTFDDGPAPESTPPLLDLLDELGVQATFFVLGSLAESHGDLVVDLVDRGHTVGLHGYCHRSHLFRTPGWIRQDTADGVAALRRLGIRPRWYRPPLGQLTARTVLEARRQGMEVALWSDWGREWTEHRSDPVLARVLGRLDSGSIVLLHDTDETSPPGTARQVRAMLPDLVVAIRRRNLRTVTLDQLIPITP